MNTQTARERGLALLPTPKAAVCTDSTALMTSVERAFREFGVVLNADHITHGPRLALVHLIPGKGVRLRAIRTAVPDVAVRLGVPSARLTTDFGVWLEISHKSPRPVELGDVLVDVDEHMELPWAIGLQANGTPMVRDLAKAPHVLVAGATGSGKSAALTSLVMSLMLTTTPEDCELVLIDTKRVDLAPLETLPHVRSAPAVTVEAALQVLQGLVSEMRHRYVLLEGMKVSELSTYNTLMREIGGQPLRRIVVLIDELADLVTVNKEAVEAELVTLAQLSRAAGIHLVCATQRPTAAVVSSQLRSQLPTRLVFAVASATDSRVALDESGAQLLLGQGDGLCKWAGCAPVRVQSPFVTQEWRDYLKWEVFHSIYEERVWQNDRNKARMVGMGVGL